MFGGSFGQSDGACIVDQYEVGVWFPKPSLYINLAIHFACFLTCTIARYSASIVNRATTCCLANDHEIAPPAPRNVYPIVDFLVVRPSSSLTSECDASQYPITVRHLGSSSQHRWYIMHRSLVDLRYARICNPEVQCIGHGSWAYRCSSATAKMMSGRVSCVTWLRQLSSLCLTWNGGLWVKWGMVESCWNQCCQRLAYVLEHSRASQTV